MSRTLDAFLKEGFVKYREARDVVETFEGEIQRRLRSILDARSDWGVFEERALKNFVDGEHRYGRWITTSISGTTKRRHEVCIDLGFWWDAPVASHPVVIYAQFFNKPRALRAFDFRGGHDGFTAVSFEGSTILLGPIPDDLDFGHLLNAQLDVLLEQLLVFETPAPKTSKRAASPKRRP